MFKYDFIILYEHRNRELENAVLLAMMLKKRGYKVAIEYRRSARILFQRAEVILTPFFYNNDNVIDFAFQPFKFYKKVINLQYEQVFSKQSEDTFENLPNEKAKNAVHISWGDESVNSLKKVGIHKSNIFEIGHISMDLNMKKYRGTFYNRRYLSRKFNLDINKKWLLFISSFSCVGLTKTEFDRWKEQTSSTEYSSEISYETQPLILEMFERLIKNNKEIIVIYRPHPHEAANKELQLLEKQHKNFRVISSFSIRQWIFTADYVSTWCSTSIVDAMFAKKNCAIIRPIPLIEEYDFKIFRDQKIIETYEELNDFINDTENHYLINDNTIKKYYCNDYHANTFEKLCDVCVEVYNNDSFCYDYSRDFNVSPFYLMKIYLYKVLLTLSSLIDYSVLVPEKYKSDVNYAHKEMNGYKKEINCYKRRFSRVFNNE